MTGKRTKPDVWSDARRLARRRLRALAEAVEHLTPGWESAEDAPRRVHVLRVAARRTGVALGTARPGHSPRTRKAARQAVRTLRRGAGGLRDGDVHRQLLLAVQAPAADPNWTVVGEVLELLARDRLAALEHLGEALRHSPPKRLRALARAVERPWFSPRAARSPRPRATRLRTRRGRWAKHRVAT